MELRHSQEVPKDMLRQTRGAQLVVPPLLQGHGGAENRPAQSSRIFGGKAVQILRARSGQLIDLADMGSGINENGRHHFCHILGGNRGRAPRAKRKPDGAVAGDLLSRPIQKEKVLLKDGRPHMYDRQSGPVQGLLGEPMLPLLR